MARFVQIKSGSGKKSAGTIAATVGGTAEQQDLFPCKHSAA